MYYIESTRAHWRGLQACARALYGDLRWRVGCRAYSVTAAYSGGGAGRARVGASEAESGLFQARRRVERSSPALGLSTVCVFYSIAAVQLYLPHCNTYIPYTRARACADLLVVYVNRVLLFVKLRYIIRKRCQ